MHFFSTSKIWLIWFHKGWGNNLALSGWRAGASCCKRIKPWLKTQVQTHTNWHRSQRKGKTIGGCFRLWQSSPIPSLHSLILQCGNVSLMAYRTYVQYTITIIKVWERWKETVPKRKIIERFLHSVPAFTIAATPMKKGKTTARSLKRANPLF